MIEQSRENAILHSVGDVMICLCLVAIRINPAAICSATAFEILGGRFAKMSKET